MRDPTSEAGASKPARKSLTLVTTHAGCEEAVESLTRLGVEGVAAYPRFDRDACANFDEAQAVLGRGFPFRSVVCPECEYRGGCEYDRRFGAAQSARHSVGTHARGAVSMAELVRGRDYITLDESPLEMLSPTAVTLTGMGGVDLVARYAQDFARSAEDRGFYRHLARVARALEGYHLSAVEGEQLPLPEPARHVPKYMYPTLNRAVVASGISPFPEATRIAVGAAVGTLDLLFVAVDEKPGAAEGDGPEVKLVRSLIGRFRTQLPEDAVVFVNDATAERADLEAALSRPVEDVTPAGRLALRHPAVQVIPTRDVTKGRKPAEVVPLLRGVLHDLPHRRVGLLTHRELADALPGLLGEADRSRLAMVGYFGGPLSRGTNRWVGASDALVVLGTPRVPPHAVREHLVKVGKVAAARLPAGEAGWGPDYWSGVTESGRRVTVRTPHYADHDWHAAYCSLVRAELLQAVGRARGVLPEGMPVYLVTRENLAPSDDGRDGFPIADRQFAPLTDRQADALAVLYRDGRRVVGKAPAVARALGVTRQQAHGLLAELKAAGRVRKVGDRGGWVATARRARGER
jgi:hypothetical protein